MHVALMVSVTKHGWSSKKKFRQKKMVMGKGYGNTNIVEIVKTVINRKSR